MESAINESLSGRSCVLVSSGDSGIYAMAGLIFEIYRNKNIQVYRPLSISWDAHPTGPVGLTLEAGAPLTHNFAAISLRDLLTKWEMIEKCLTSAGHSRFCHCPLQPQKQKTDLAVPAGPRTDSGTSGGSHAGGWW